MLLIKKSAPKSEPKTLMFGSMSKKRRRTYLNILLPSALPYFLLHSTENHEEQRAKKVWITGILQTQTLFHTYTDSLPGAFQHGLPASKTAFSLIILIIRTLLHMFWSFVNSMNITYIVTDIYIATPPLCIYYI